MRATKRHKRSGTRGDSESVRFEDEIFAFCGTIHIRVRTKQPRKSRENNEIITVPRSTIVAMSQRNLSSDSRFSAFRESLVEESVALRHVRDIDLGIQSRKHDVLSKCNALISEPRCGEYKCCDTSHAESKWELRRCREYPIIAISLSIFRYMYTHIFVCIVPFNLCDTTIRFPDYSVL